jgi:uncharacterized RmlC-like cupin family protein
MDRYRLPPAIASLFHIPAQLPHQELNPTDETVTWVVIRSGPQPIVVNLPRFESPLTDTHHEQSGQNRR